MNEWLSESGPEATKPLSIETETATDPDEQIFVRCMPSPYDLSHLRRNSAGGVRTSGPATSVWSAKKVSSVLWFSSLVLHPLSRKSTIFRTQIFQKVDNWS